MQDYKYLREPVQKDSGSRPTFLEMVGFAAIVVGVTYGLGYYALVQAFG